MKRMVVCGMAMLLFALVGCGSGGDDDDDSGTNPGTGSGTLLIDAEVDVTEALPSATDASQFVAAFTVTVSKAGAPVSGAQVVISASGSQVTLLESVTTIGEYAGVLSTYYQSYGLDIASGTDTIIGARVLGPPFHTISAPAQNSLHPANQDLPVQWSPAGATFASVETSEMNQANTTDSGTFTVPGTLLTGDPGNIADDEVTVRREEQTVLGGGFAGSTLRVTIRNMVEFQLDGT